MAVVANPTAAPAANEPDRQAAQNPDASKIPAARAVDTSERVWKSVRGEDCERDDLNDAFDKMMSFKSLLFTQMDDGRLHFM